MNVSVKRVITEAIDLMNTHKMNKDVVIQHLVNRYEKNNQNKSDSVSSKTDVATTWASSKRKSPKVSDTYNIKIPRTHRQSNNDIKHAVSMLYRMKTLKNHQHMSIADCAMVLGTTEDSLRRRIGRATRDGIRSPFQVAQVNEVSRRETSGIALFLWAARERERGYNTYWRVSAEAYRHAALLLQILPI